jgi:hypothetical protein
MPLSDSPLLSNWIPDIGGLRSRGGFFEWAINFPDDLVVRTIMTYFPEDETFPSGAFLVKPSVLAGTVFAATDDGIYNITTETNAPTLSEALSGTSMAGWLSHTMFTNDAGPFLMVCSEVDGYKYYDGAAWATPVAGVAPGEIDGVDPANLVHVSVWKKRLWFVERDTTKAWYLDANAITGTAAAFNFGPQFKHGGHLLFIANWTIDAGEGIDDFLVAVGSNGDVVIYQGSDPTAAETFSLVGSWYVGQMPVGRRAYTQIGGDLAILSTEGVFPVSYITRGGGDFLSAGGKEYSTKIRPSLGEAMKQSFTSRGWQLSTLSSQRLLLVNVPDYEFGDTTVASTQFCMNTSLFSWTTLSGIPAYCLGETPGFSLAGTTDGRVLLILNGDYDNVPFGASDGDPIEHVVQFAFSTFDKPALIKQFLMLQATYLSTVKPATSLSVNVDYTYAPPASVTANANPSSETLWDGDATDPLSLFGSGFWDGVPPERGARYSGWRNVTGLGYAGAATIRNSLTAPTTLVSVDYMFAPGGPM